MEENSSCCSGGSGCCTPKIMQKEIVIDFLYLDLSVCERCQGTESSLDSAITDVSAVLKAAGFNVILNKINIATRELAIQYHFISSPTIRINGNDIEMQEKESSCKECGDLCGDDVDCRVWVYDGIDYNVPPKEFIVNSILKEVYSNKSVTSDRNDYTMPDNLKKYFDALESR